MKLPLIGDASVDSVVCDPPYELGFMGREWDSTGVAYEVDLWREVLRVLKPGAHLLSFGGTRTYHRMTCAIEDAGFEIRDSIHWIYGSGFPKALNVSVALDKAARGCPQGGKDPEKRGRGSNASRSVLSRGGSTGKSESGLTCKYLRHEPITEAARKWVGWATALKPAHEPIVVARKPLEGTVAANVLAHGTGAMNVDACRIGRHINRRPSGIDRLNSANALRGYRPFSYSKGPQPPRQSAEGRWPANVVLDEEAGRDLDEQSGLQAARFFYCAKVSKAERGEGNTHPTVKPVSLMRWLVRLVTPPGGLVLDPFAGSGSTGVAAIREGCSFVGIERDVEAAIIARKRLREEKGKTVGATEGLCSS